jgi:hypothetical protein
VYINDGVDSLTKFKWVSISSLVGNILEHRMQIRVSGMIQIVGIHSKVGFNSIQ